jgi:hypothetical protein
MTMVAVIRVFMPALLFDVFDRAQRDCHDMFDFFLG